jgi:hypothetical protein
MAENLVVSPIFFMIDRVFDVRFPQRSAFDLALWTVGCGRRGDEMVLIFGGPK